MSLLSINAEGRRLQPPVRAPEVVATAIRLPPLRYAKNIPASRCTDESHSSHSEGWDDAVFAVYDKLLKEGYAVFPPT